MGFLSRRTFIRLAGLLTLRSVLPRSSGYATSAAGSISLPANDRGRSILLFLCGDVMTGRGIDQVLPHPGDPQLHESYLRSALDYVALAEEANGKIARPVDPSYIWGEALEVFRVVRPVARIVNLETAVTRSDEAWPGKGIHYRMHPKNVGCLTAAGVDCCVLANNHALDWGHAGLEETLATLGEAGLQTAGAGRNLREAEAPAVIATQGAGRVIVFAFGHRLSGIPKAWAAGEAQPGVNLLPDFSKVTLAHLEQGLGAVKQEADIAVASIHWGGNWGYRVPVQERTFAHQLIDAGFDVVHGHSSHHPKGIEVYRGRPILYGCGDLINDYEGIGGHDQYHGHLSFLYFPALVPGEGLVQFEMVPMEIRRFRLHRATGENARWLVRNTDRWSRNFGCRLRQTEDGRVLLRWE